jgi:arsenite methyltransferase
MTFYEYDNRHLAEIYDKISDMQFESGKRIVERLGVIPGHRILDVGCGTGRLACWIYDHVGQSGTVAGIDPLAERIAIARERNSKIHFAVGIAEDLSDFPDGSFDSVCLSSVFHWVPDKHKALEEIHRVLRPGGRIGCTTTSKELHLDGTMLKTCVSVFTQSPYLESLDISSTESLFKHLTTTEIVTMLNELGFELIELHLLRRMQTFQSGEEVVDFAEASSFGNLTSIVPEHLRPQLRDDLVKSFEKRKEDNRITLHHFGTLFIAEKNRD